VHSTDRRPAVISGGFNIYLQVIEQAIYEHLEVAEAPVIGISHA
jgi:long-chain acyl-CoA synthetase